MTRRQGPLRDLRVVELAGLAAWGFAEAEVRALCDPGVAYAAETAAA